jgi:hypothetical protein
MDEEEVNFDDEEKSSYVRTEAVDAEITQIFRELCKLHDSSSNLGYEFQVYPLKRECLNLFSIITQFSMT